MAEAFNEQMRVLRMVGIMSIGVGVAWLLQMLSCADCTGLDLMAWLLGSAAFAGAGSGLLLVHERLKAEDGPALERLWRLNAAA